MSGSGPGDPGTTEQSAAEPSAAEQSAADRARRRRLAEVFGEVLPESTRDDLDDRTDGEGGSGSADARSAWLRREVPPHHL